MLSPINLRDNWTELSGMVEGMSKITLVMNIFWIRQPRQRTGDRCIFKALGIRDKIGTCRDYWGSFKRNRIRQQAVRPTAA